MLPKYGPLLFHALLLLSFRLLPTHEASSPLSFSSGAGLTDVFKYCEEWKLGYN